MKCLQLIVRLILFWLGLQTVILYTNVPNQIPTFTIPTFTETKAYVPVVTLSIQDNAKLLPQLKSDFKRTLNWNKYMAKPELLRRNPNLNHLVEPSFQAVNRRFALAFEKDAQRKSSKIYYLPNVKIKDCNGMIDGETFFDRPMKNNK